MDKDNQEGGSGNHQGATGSKEKGKSKETRNELDKDEPSMISRLQDSARMAGGALINNRAGLQDMPSSLEGKGMQASSSSSSAGRDQYRNAQSDTARQVPTAAPGETFRQTQREAPSSARAFDNFVEMHQPLPDIGNASLDTGAPTPKSAGLSSSGVEVAHAEATDGSAVADLLSMPDDTTMMPTMEEQVETISPEDAAKLRAALFEGPSSGNLPWDHLLNFTPDFASLRSPPEESQRERESLLGTADQDSAADTWLRQWHGVLVGYTDEVWGDLGMLVEQAKKEVEKDMANFGDERTETPALSRLKMLLAHIRGPS